MTCCTDGCGATANHRVTVDDVVLVVCDVCAGRIEETLGEACPPVIQLPHSIPIAVR